MPSSDDNQDHPQDHAKTLPSPELNPLTNPVLGRNMGRWAEVYFTSPPERREQAVQELLRELEHDAAGVDPATPRESDKGEQGGTEEDRATRAPDPRHVSPFLEGSTPCPRCGEEAPAQQRFCSACGAPLAARERLLRSDLPNEIHKASSTIELGTWSAEERPDLYGVEEFREERADPLPARATESINDIGFSWERAEKSIAEEPPILFADHRRARRLRNRALMAAALAILIGTFFYVAGRETAGWVRATHELPRATSAETRSAAASPRAQAVNSVERVAAPVDRAQPTVQTGVSPTLLAPAGQETKTGSAEDKPSTSQGRGAEELAVAESYLDGTQAKPRDSSEAAKWLWKAVAKENARATLLLSDLYVRGDGVPQNCDQARLLLDAAASKGVPGAGERIRELPNVGCQ